MLRHQATHRATPGGRECWLAAPEHAGTCGRQRLNPIIKDEIYIHLRLTTHQGCKRAKKANLAPSGLKAGYKLVRGRKQPSLSFIHCTSRVLILYALNFEVYQVKTAKCFSAERRPPFLMFYTCAAAAKKLRAPHSVCLSWHTLLAP